MYTCELIEEIKNGIKTATLKKDGSVFFMASISREAFDKLNEETNTQKGPQENDTSRTH